MRRTLTGIAAAALLAVSASGLVAAPALGAGQAAPVADCNAHGRLTRTYTANQLQTALTTMPADIKEYTDCYDVIQRALLARVGGHRASTTGDSNSSGGSFLPTPVIVVIVLLVLAAATFAALAVRRRTPPPPGGPDEP
jgi:hypothetical protein